MRVSLLDYGAGNVRSVRNAIMAAAPDCEIINVSSPKDIDEAGILVFPGVGSFGTAMSVLEEKGYVEPLRRYLKDQDRPFLGICLGMQTLFSSSEEDNDHVGLGVIPGRVTRFDATQAPVPHIGWNGRIYHHNNNDTTTEEDHHVYFVHSYYAPIEEDNHDWVWTSTTYGGTRFISSVRKGCVVATQFHPEKSGDTGLHMLRDFFRFIQTQPPITSSTAIVPIVPTTQKTTCLVKRVVVALDVRTNDDGDLVVTKGDQYDVREKNDDKAVRNLGKPVSLASRYYREGADEICFLNITSFREGVLDDMPMLGVLEAASQHIFVPLTVGGGIRDYRDPVSGHTYTALEVASRYFRAGADKVSIGSDAVLASERYTKEGHKSGKTSLETISRVYGVQAVVVSIDPKRRSVDSFRENDERHVYLETGGGGYCWYPCTIKGGREERDICAVTVAKCAEALGAGEIMLNCIDADGQGQGFDHVLMRAVSDAVSIPVIASSGAGKAQHFTSVFQETNVQAALAAGMFHRQEVEIEAVKQHMRQHNIPARTK